MLDQGFSGGSFSLFGGSANSGRTLHNLSASSESRAPNRRAEICGRRGPPVSEEDSGSAIAFTNNAPDRADGPSMRVGLMASSGQSNAVGQRVGNRIALGPRDNFDPVQVYIGRKPGSTEIARRPGGEAPAPSVQAFAPEAKRTARGNPLALHNAAITPGASAGIGRAKIAPVRPASAASLANRSTPKANAPKAEPAKAQSAALQPTAKVKADAARKAKAATSAKTQPAKKNAKTEPKA